MLAEIFRRQRAERFRQEGRAQLADELEREMDGLQSLEEVREILKMIREMEDGDGRTDLGVGKG